MLILEGRIDDAVGRQHMRLNVLHADGRERCQRATTYWDDQFHAQIERNKVKIMRQMKLELKLKVDWPKEVPNGGV